MPWLNCCHSMTHFRRSTMSAAKKQSPSIFERLRRLTAWLIGPGRGVLLFALLLGVFGGGWYFVQHRLWPRIAGSPEYRVGLEQVEITPPPSWIHADIRAEVFHAPALDGPLSFLDDDLAERIHAAFGRHPWVARVRRVWKRHGGVQVELEYRKPVCMVVLPGGLLPVVAEGVLVATEDFTPPEAARYPRVVGIDRLPAVPAGERWPDARVIGGAEIAAAFGDLWEPMRLRAIVPLPDDPAALGKTVENPRVVRPSEPFFRIDVHSGTRILWGYAPGAGALGEPPAAKKGAWLQQYLARHDSLDGPQGKPQVLDVHRLP